LQTEKSPYRYRGIFHALSTVLREEGPRALYKGWVPSVIGVVSIFFVHIFGCYFGPDNYNQDDGIYLFLILEDRTSKKKNQNVCRFNNIFIYYLATVLVDLTIV
jgi:hypothetical protein